MLFDTHCIISHTVSRLSVSVTVCPSMCVVTLNVASQNRLGASTRSISPDHGHQTCKPVTTGFAPLAPGTSLSVQYFMQGHKALRRSRNAMVALVSAADGNSALHRLRQSREVNGRGPAPPYSAGLPARNRFRLRAISPNGTGTC